MSNIPNFRTFACLKLKMDYNIHIFSHAGISQKKMDYSSINGRFQDLTKLYVPKLKMEYSKNFKQRKYVPGVRKVEPGELGVR